MKKVGILKLFDQCLGFFFFFVVLSKPDHREELSYPNRLDADLFCAKVNQE